MTWSWRKWLQHAFPRNKSKSGRSPRPELRRTARLDLEQLENRVLPALVINPTFAPNILADPQTATIQATINTAIQNLESAFTSNVTVDITFQEMATGLGMSQWSYVTVTYTQYRAALIAHATSPAQLTADATLPPGPNNPVNGSTFIDIQVANAQALGLNFGPPDTPTVSLNTSICNLNRVGINPAKYDLQAVVEHEMDECLGISSELSGLANGAAAPTGDIWTEDLFRYSSTPGVRSFDTGINTQAYFSIDGGVTDLAQYNQFAGGDFNDWYSYYGGNVPQVQDAFATPGATPNYGVELTVLAVLGYTPATGIVTSITPTSGSTLGGTSVTINGSDFGGVTGVSFGGVPATSFTIISPTQIVATAPAEAAGVVDVTVANSGGNSPTSPADQFTYQAPPAVLSLSPTSGGTFGGTSVIITGSNFTGATAVAFSGTPATSFTVNSPTQITAVAPAHAAGLVNVTVTSPSGTSAVTAGDQFTYVTSTAVTALTPDDDSSAGGSTIIITGASFVGVTAVAFGATPATSFTVNSPTQITAIDPAGAAGSVNVTVTGAGGTSALAPGNLFTYVGPASLAMSTITIAPPSIPSGSSATVTVQTKDALGNDLTTGGLTVTLGVGAGAGNGTFGAVTYIGGGAYTATFTGTVFGANTITGAIGGSAITSAPPTVNITAGPFSPAQSVVSIAPASIASGTSAIVTLQAKDASGNNESTGGLTVTFSLGAGSATGTFSGVTYIGSGEYTATFTGAAVGNNIITATINTQSVTSTPPTVTVTAGAFSVSQSSVTVTPASITSGGSAVVTLTARDSNGNVETGSNYTVTFGLGAGSATGSFGAVTDHGNGVYTATFTGILAGANTITATINTLAVTSTPPTITVSAGPFSLAQSIVSVVPASIAAGSTATVTLTARDAAGNPETGSNYTVAFSLGAGTATGTFGPVSNTGNGIYSATFTGMIAGANTISATINSLAVTAPHPTVTVTPGPFSLAESLITLNPAVIPAGGASIVTLTARDAFGNQETSGSLTVAFALGVGTITGGFGATNNNGNGTYSANFTAGSAIGSSTITATINNNAVTAPPPTLTVTAAAPSLSQSLVTIAPSTIASGTTAIVTLTAIDRFGNPDTSGGSTITFGLGVGSGTGTFGSTFDNHNGTYNAIFTGVLAGTNTITAFIGGLAVTSTLPTVTITPGAVSTTMSLITIAPASIQAGTAATVTLQTRDAAGNNETTGGQSVLFALTTGAGASGTFGPVSYTGNGVYTGSFTGVLAGSNTITASINSNGGVTPAAITVTPGPFDLGQSTVTLSPAIIPAGGATTVTLTARDAFGNQLTTGLLAVSFSLGTGDIGGIFGPTTDHGDGTYTAVFGAGTEPGSGLILGAINNLTLTSTPPTLTVTPAVVSLSQSFVTINPGSIQAGSAATVTLTARDAFGNVETNANLTSVAFVLGAGAASGTFGPVVNNHDGTYTATFTGALAGTNTINADIAGQPLTTPPPSIIVTAGPVDTTQSFVSVSPASISVNGATTVTLTALDSFDNPNPTGVLNVAFNLSGGNISGNFGPVTGSNGVYSATFTAGTGAGSGLISASINGIAVTSAPAPLTVTAGPFDLNQSSVTITPASIQSGNSANVMLTTRDAFGNSLTSDGLTVQFGLGAGSASGSFSTVSDNHNGTYTATFTGALAGTNIVTATIDGQAVTAPAPTVTVTPAPFTLAQSNVTVVPATIPSGGTATVTLTARDAEGNAETGGNLAVFFSLGAGSATGSFGVVTNNNNGAYTATFTGLNAGANTITATIDGQPVTSAPAPITVTAGAFNLANSSVTIASTSIALGGAATVTLTARDADGNLETGANLTVSFGLGGGVGQGSFGPVTNNHDGTWTATMTGAAVGSNTVTATIDAQTVASTPPAFAVTPGLTTTVVSANPAAGALFSAPVTFAAVVTPTVPGFGVPANGDTVTFYADGNSIGAGILAGGVATLGYRGLSVGAHTVTASFGGDANFASSTGGLANAYPVSQAGTNVLVGAGPTSSVFGQAVTLTANLTSTNAGATVSGGTVSFYDGAANPLNLLGTAGVTGGTASITTTALSVNAAHTIVAVYAGAGNFAAGTGSLANVAVGLAGTTVALTSSAPISGNGQPITLTAGVSANSPSSALVANGLVTFFDGATQLATVMLNNANTASFTTAALTSASQSITASFADPFDDFLSSTSNPLTQTVTSASTITATPALQSSVFGQPVSLAIKVTGTVGTSSDIVTVTQGSAVLGSGTLSSAGTANVSVTPLNVGLDPVLVSFSGDSTYAPSSTTVNLAVAPAGTTITLAAPIATVVGQSATFTANMSVASPGAGSLAGLTVTFETGSTILGSGILSATGANSYAASFTTGPTQLTAGNTPITASFVATANFNASSSAPQTQVVAAAKTGAVLSSSAPAGSNFADPVTFTANVTATNGAAATGGSVSFYDGSVLLGATAVSNGAASVTTSTLPTGNDTIRAVYAGTGSFGGSSAASIVQSVTASPTSTAVSSSTGGASGFGQAVTFTAAVSLLSSDTVSFAGGSVSFFDGTKLLGKETLSAPGVAKFTTSSLAVNAGHTITAVYAGNANLAGSTSAPFVQTVNPSGTAVTLTASPAAWTVGKAISFTAAVTGATGGTVTFSIDGVSMHTSAVSAGKATYRFAGFTSGGEHTVDVTYNPTSANVAPSSAELDQNVLYASTVALRATPSPAPAGQAVTLSAAVTGLVGTPTGAVSFYDGTKYLGTVDLDVNGDATLTLGNWSTGTHRITASYSGDTNYNADTTAPLSLLVQGKTATRLV